MKITIEYFEKKIKSPHFLHLTSINLCKNDVKVGIYLKLLLIKSNSVVFLLIGKG